ncbi:hypothetical protein BAMA_15620 [Bacillus manliponensis]|uniref:Lipoprotein n=1 Tax=Bacillus manliponensis TaxID=574376 RepID=A0A073JSU8_9BACI|nr:hypothetical protein [Bacillus manliponensis]KEK17380.1 hypothetical protein BAMA_15620 [Bacillus manliponensis]
MNKKILATLACGTLLTIAGCGSEEKTVKDEPKQAELTKKEEDTTQESSKEENAATSEQSTEEAAPTQEPTDEETTTTPTESTNEETSQLNQNEYTDIYKQIEQKYHELNTEFESQRQNYDSTTFGQFSFKFTSEVRELKDKIPSGNMQDASFNLSVAAGSLYSLHMGYEDILSGENLTEANKLVTAMKKDIEDNLKIANERLTQ